MPRPKPTIHLRPVTPNDFPRLTSILISSFPADPEWTYRFPHAKQFPEDHYEHTLRRVADYFENAQRGAIDMVLAEIDNISEPADEPNMIKEPSVIMYTKLELPPSQPPRTIVGFAAWQMPGTHGTAEGDPGREMKFPSTSKERRDADQRHVEAYSAVMYNKKESVFDSVYGERQAHLCLLGVDPGFQGLGAGGALVEDGMEKARRGGYVLTLFATGPGGRRLYARKGFEEVVWVEVGPVEGESEMLRFPAMVWRDGG